ncbi:cobalamin biosynthesis protein [Oculatella sp. FACHB-28]|uniref:adenosylcobinamide-phosphate synthase CbiB n=1 Tax=Oculatella sp. FACHB-28 TaxID=2692845 RepID=UPI001687AEA7|nr:adenosylcobinamide-phosphate synthase CbiB [Oculatella sp. FACHB-28]MBD2057469.1 cobalamin biosynthesis protein [Oculatella sp. FACHB-28]
MISITPWTHDFAIAGLAIASLLDYLIGDPWNWLHPVQVIGWMISRYTHLVLKQFESPLSLRIAGVILGLGMIGGSGVAGWLIVQVTGWIHWGGAIAVSSILLASCFAGRSLRTAAQDVLQPLKTGDLATARSKLSLYVGRDTAQLTEPEILRAVFETVTENATDGVMAPLFWAIIGAFTPIGSVPFALAYKAASTLDSMVGYREAPYTHLGWFSARLEDYLTWIPCRLMVLTLSLLSGKPKYVWQICCRDAPQDPSPNAGWSECAYAAVVGVQVGGVNVYKGTVKHKPLLGDSIHPITPARIEQAMELTRWMFLIWVAIAILTLWLS